MILNFIHNQLEILLVLLLTFLMTLCLFTDLFERLKTIFEKYFMLIALELDGAELASGHSQLIIQLLYLINDRLLGYLTSQNVNFALKAVL